jgi:hypothetical protein
MRFALTLACSSIFLVSGCQLKGSKNGEVPPNVDTQVEQGPPNAKSLPSQCRPSSTFEVQALYDSTEDSVHELVTCGGIQMKVAMSMKLMIFSSNESLVSASARQDIRDVVEAVGLTVDNPFTLQADGSWQMEAGGTAGSTFSLRFYDPESGEPIAVDPFKLDSYLTGVTATSSQTWEQMKANPTSKTTFTYVWTDRGPLAHLLAGGGDIPNPFTLKMSLLELGGAALGLSDPDYGPFASVENALVESTIHMVDDRGGVDITYDVTGVKDTVKNLVESSSFGFDIQSLVSTDGTFHLSGDTKGLAFLGRGSLAGEINYTVSGGGLSLLVTSDFGAGEAYATPRWECR